jgi:hypothetical protein
MATTRESGKSSAPVVGLEATTGRKVEKSVDTGQLSVEDKGLLHLSGSRRDSRLSMPYPMRPLEPHNTAYSMEQTEEWRSVSRSISRASLNIKEEPNDITRLFLGVGMK